MSENITFHAHFMQFIESTLLQRFEKKHRETKRMLLVKLSQYLKHLKKIERQNIQHKVGMVNLLTPPPVGD